MFVLLFNYDLVQLSRHSTKTVKTHSFYKKSPAKAAVADLARSGPGVSYVADGIVHG